MTNWYDDDSFWETFRNYMFNPARVELARIEVDSLLALLELSPGHMCSTSAAAPDAMLLSLRDEVSR
jgi:hypothetical protein